MKERQRKKQQRKRCREREKWVIPYMQNIFKDLVTKGSYDSYNNEPCTIATSSKGEDITI